MSPDAHSLQPLWAARGPRDRQELLRGHLGSAWTGPGTNALAEEPPLGIDSTLVL